MHCYSVVKKQIHGGGKFAMFFMPKGMIIQSNNLALIIKVVLSTSSNADLTFHKFNYKFKVEIYSIFSN